MLAIKKHVSLFIVMLAALQILNLGLYTQRLSAVGDAFGHKLNIINSVTEYVAEVVTKKHNAFPERNEGPNQNGHTATCKFQLFKTYVYAAHSYSNDSTAIIPNYAGYLVPAYRNHTTDITAPPPKWPA